MRRNNKSKYIFWVTYQLIKIVLITFGIKYLFCFSVLQISSKMSNITETKEHHWKLTANRKSRMQRAFQPTVSKKKFTPLKDTSIRESKVFERSRQRSNSSFAGLNRSRDIDTVSIRDKKNDKMQQSIKSIHPEPSVLISTIKNSEFRLSDSVQYAKHHASARNTMAELQKQFKQFKEKVMKLIQRQQQQINQLAKEMINTFQFQLSKLKQLKVSKCEHCQLESETSKQQSKSLQPQRNLSTNSKIDAKIQNKPQAKEIEQIKQQLNKKLQKLKKNQPLLKNDDKNTILRKAISTREIPVLNFQKIHSRFDNVFDIFNKLKSDMNEMQQIRASLQKKTTSSTIPQNEPPSNPTAKK